MEGYIGNIHGIAAGKKKTQIFQRAHYMIQDKPSAFYLY
jgi:hypothetical protein